MGEDYRVYPRVGGGTASLRWTKSLDCGLSPRGRGNLCEVYVLDAQGGSIPAWAGEPWRPTMTAFAWTVYPRVGGGTRWRCRRTPSRLGLSPRGRGNLLVEVIPYSFPRSIPAWAGEPADMLY